MKRIVDINTLRISLGPPTNHISVNRCKKKDMIFLVGVDGIA